ncbi:MAG: DNA alkylation repair protein [Campylobacterota bacterium]|nr:DNA alkylation repair protein [Campylobacterota bacterium]
MTAEKTLLKEILFNPIKIKKIATEIKSVYPEFQEKYFEEESCDMLHELELKARIYHIRDMLGKYLPIGFESAVKILLDSLPQALDPSKQDNDFGDFIYAPYSEFVTLHGCRREKIDISLQALREITKRFSVEFAIRDFINAYPEETLAMLDACALSENYHERRLVSESLRPKLPWAKRLKLDYRIPLSRLDKLFSDKTRYVTRSVANHLNDIAKIDAFLVIETLKKWKASGKQNPKEMAYIINHALRTLVKEGHEEALALLGYARTPNISVKHFTVETKEVQIGEALIFELMIEAKEDTKVMLDYIVHFRTKAGHYSPKVYKLKKIALQKDQSLLLKKRHLFKANMSTRKLYEGEHKIEVQMNGVNYEERLFMLKKSDRS